MSTRGFLKKFLSLVCILLAFPFIARPAASSKESSDSFNRVFMQDGISLEYSAQLFPSLKLEILPQLTYGKSKNNPRPFMVGPKRWKITLEHPSRDSQSPEKSSSLESGAIYITPLAGYGTTSFAKKYPQLSGCAKYLKMLFADKTRSLDMGLPEEPWINAGPQINAKIARVESFTAEGVRGLCYYRQENPRIGVNNSELVYNFQGISKDGRYYVSARIRIRNNRLPDSEKDPRTQSDGSMEDLAREQKRVNSFPDNSFFPTLQALDAMMASITIKR